MMEQKWAHTKNVLRPFVRVVRDGYSVVLVLVYHHIDEAPGNGRFPFLSRVSPSQFRWQINLLRRLGRFVSLEEIREARNLATINYAITLEGVSASIL